MHQVDVLQPRASHGLGQNKKRKGQNSELAIYIRRKGGFIHQLFLYKAF